jgi:hypothetical protein
MFLNNKNASFFVPFVCFVVKCLASFEHDFTGKILTSPPLHCKTHPPTDTKILTILGCGRKRLAISPAGK